MLIPCLTPLLSVIPRYPSKVMLYQCWCGSRRNYWFEIENSCRNILYHPTLYPITICNDDNVRARRVGGAIDQEPNTNLTLTPTLNWSHAHARYEQLGLVHSFMFNGQSLKFLHYICLRNPKQWLQLIHTLEQNRMNFVHIADVCILWLKGQIDYICEYCAFNPNVIITGALIYSYDI